MTSERRNAPSPGSRKEDYELTVLDFLDKELEAASTSAAGRSSQRDDVEELVDNLLQEAIAASGLPESPGESGPEDMNLLLSRALGGRDETPPVTQAVSDRKVHEEPTAPAISAPDFDAVNSAVPAPVFAAASHPQAGRGRLLILCGAFACLLAATGIVYLSGSLRSSGDDADVATDAVLPNPDAPAVPAAGADERKSPPATAGATASTATSATSKVSKNSDTEPAAANHAMPSLPPSARVSPRTPAEAQPPANALPGGPAEKPASTLWNAAENSAASLPVPASGAPGLLPAQPLAGALKNLIPKPAGGPVTKPPAQVIHQVVPAEVVSQVAPVYPELARRSRVTGTIVVEAVVDEQGRVVKATAVSGPFLLRAEAVNAVLRWRFRPATINGTSVTSTSNVSIVFK